MIGYLLVAALCVFHDVSAVNLALKKPATQSSAYKRYYGNRAVDGNTDGHWVKGQSCYASAPHDAKPWWMVDLSDVVSVHDVTIYNRADGWGNRLRNLEITVYKENPTKIKDAKGVLCAAYDGPGRNGEIVTLTCTEKAEGRYVRIVKTKINKDDLLSFCEVEIGGEAFATSEANLALKKTVTQSSAYGNYYGDRAVDGNTEMKWTVGHSCYASESGDASPWWMVDLEGVYSIKSVTIYNRADGWGERLRNLLVTVHMNNTDVSGSDGAVCAVYNGPATNGEIVNIHCDGNVEGRYVRIVKPNKVDAEDLLSFCEVVVEGEGSSCPVGFVDVGGECLIFSTTYGTFAEAVTYCDIVDSTLVMLKTEQLDTAVREYLSKNDLRGNYYVGASDMAEDKVYRWMDGEVVNAKWRPDNSKNEPMDVTNRKSGCGYLNGTSNYEWEAMHCHEAMNFICQHL